MLSIVCNIRLRELKAFQVRPEFVRMEEERMLLNYLDFPPLGFHPTLHSKLSHNT